MKNKKSLLILLLVLILAGIIGFLLLNLNSASLTNKSSINEFHNNKLGYTISYEAPWRIAKYYSLEISAVNKMSELLNSIGCNESMNVIGEESEELFKKDKDCLRNSPERKALNEEYLHFLTNWSSEDDEFVALTNLTATIEKEKIEELKGFDNTILDFPIKYNAISIYPSEKILDFDSESNKSKLTSKFIYLPNGKRAYQSEIYLFEPSIEQEVKHLIVHIPIDKELYEALAFETIASKDSAEEEQFYKILNSIIIN